MTTIREQLQHFRLDELSQSCMLSNGGTVVAKLRPSPIRITELRDVSAVNGIL